MASSVRDYFVVQHAFAMPGRAKFDYNYRVADYSGVANGLLQGVMAVPDVANDLRLTPSDKAGFAVAEVGAYLIAPLVKDGRLDAILSVHVPEARPWSEAERSLIAEVAERDGGLTGRLRAASARGYRTGQRNATRRHVVAGSRNAGRPW